MSHCIVTGEYRGSTSRAASVTGGSSMAAAAALAAVVAAAWAAALLVALGAPVALAAACCKMGWSQNVAAAFAACGGPAVSLVGSPAA